MGLHLPCWSGPLTFLLILWAFFLLTANLHLHRWITAIAQWPLEVFCIHYDTEYIFCLPDKYFQYICLNSESLSPLGVLSQTQGPVELGALQTLQPQQPMKISNPQLIFWEFVLSLKAQLRSNSPTRRAKPCETILQGGSAIGFYTTCLHCLTITCVFNFLQSSNQSRQGFRQTLCMLWLIWC